MTTPSTSPTCLLSVGGNTWSGWQEVTLHWSMREIARTFEVGVTERWPGLTDMSPLKAGMVAGVLVSGPGLICSGYIDLDEVNYDASSHTAHFAGRGRAAELVDSSVLPPWEYRAQDLVQIASALVEPFGLTARALVDVGAVFDRFAIRPGETVFAVIERACRMRAVLPMSDKWGNLLFVRAGIGGPAPAALKRGGIDGNILRAGRKRDFSRRYSQYIALGQQAGSDACSAEDRAGPSAMITDPEITRYRPAVLVAEQQGDAAALKARAGWQATVARAKSLTLQVTVQGWFAGASGKIWAPNTLVQLQDDWLRCDGTYLIESVTLSRGASGTTTTLDLVAPDAYTPNPQEEGEDA